MRIAVGSKDGKSISGHIGRCANWIVYDIDVDAEPVSAAEVERLSLPKELVFHYYKDDKPHPLKSCSAIIGASCGDSFSRKMKKRGIDVVLTAESDPAKAVVDFVRDNVVPAKPRPIGGLVCKIMDSISKHD